VGDGANAEGRGGGGHGGGSCRLKRQDVDIYGVAAVRLAPFRISSPTVTPHAPREDAFSQASRSYR
jgi:hypothetical protein